MAETANDLQAALDAMQEYCVNWGTTVIVDKTQIAIFSRGKVRNFP